MASREIIASPLAVSKTEFESLSRSEVGETIGLEALPAARPSPMCGEARVSGSIGGDMLRSVASFVAWRANEDMMRSQSYGTAGDGF